MTKICCLVAIFLNTICVSQCESLTKKCLAANGRCGKKGVNCTETLVDGWKSEGTCCYGDPCCKIIGYSCGFETEGAACIFQDTDTDEFDWTRRTLKTGSSDTGPLSAAEGDYYIFIESSSPRVNGDKAVLTTEDVSLPVSSWCLTFQYHMYGSEIGDLEVFAGEKLSNLTSLWKRTGEQPDPLLWKNASITIPEYFKTVITIEGVRATSLRGDIAIDDITLNPGTCSINN